MVVRRYGEPTILVRGGAGTGIQNRLKTDRPHGLVGSNPTRRIDAPSRAAPPRPPAMARGPQQVPDREADRHPSLDLRDWLAPTRERARDPRGSCVVVRA